MATKALPSPEVLRQLLRYEPETGKLFWLPRPLEFFAANSRNPEDAKKAWDTRYANAEAFITSSPLGYRYGAIFGLTQRAHRVIWALHSGAWPDQEIDHIDGDRANNKWVNLREATHAENNRNVRRHRDNKSGFKGVSWHARDKIWAARIYANGKNTSLGYFKKAEDAHAAYVAASKELHGVFGRAS